MKIMIAATSALLLAGGVASAATATPPPAKSQTQAGSQNQAATPAHPANLQQQVQNNLTKAGFTDIKIMPESFLVRAKDQQGNSVMMVMNPDSFTEVTAVAPGKANSSTASVAPNTPTTKQ